ncbi:apolipoprotein N-acyltransferase [Aquimarina sp. ERC-38]|uniref:apolipoprotein N-acyltransferase n=1 Tax=Aquimarina sp. ERC-38 TaxID=2949996 RepID=UPI0022476452|nr:apolipoprotein N-acyltransferase [Aquimarina sp. ERC-38]UZO79430.1 apolipoprotein N-acyltransferase [Aquimarina sp. ERC-38]
MRFILLSLLSGVILALSWPTYGFPLLLFFGFIPLLYVEKQIRDTKKHALLAFGYAFIAFFVWNVSTTWWIYNSTAFGMWFAEIANTILMSSVFWLYHVVARRVSFQMSAIFLCCLWLSFEYLHLHWEFSWPWLNLGNGFANFTSLVQWYEYTGVSGGSLWILILNFRIFKSLLLYLQHRDISIVKRSALTNGSFIIVPMLLSLFLFYSYEEKGDQVQVAILQPNIDPYLEKYATNDKVVGKLLIEMTDTLAKDNIQFYIAPETVFADNNRLRKFEFSKAKRTANKIIKGSKESYFLSGISMIDVFSDQKKIRKQTNEFKEGVYFDDYNSAFFIRPDYSYELYHKSKLVVGVENFPYQKFLKPILGDAMIDLGGTVAKKTTQDDREVFFTRDSIGAAPIICYESVYGEYVTGYVRNGADFLSIITNDAWWGNTQGHQQHLAYAKLRAIETRRSIARSANTGISAIINQKGEIVASLPYKDKGVLTGSLFTNDTITFYVKAGDYLARVAIFMMVFIFLYAVTRRRGAVGL